MPWFRPATDTPFGALPYDQVLRIDAFYKDSGANAIYPGDFTIQEADGGVAASAASSAVIVGVAVVYHAASTENTEFLVYSDPKQLFVAQDDGDTTHMARTEIGTNADLVVTTGDTSTLRSLHEIDSSSATTTAGLAVKILRLHPMEKDSYASAAGSPRKWVILINSHLFGGFEVTGI